MVAARGNNGGVRYAVIGLAVLALCAFCGTGTLGAAWLWRAQTASSGGSAGGGGGGGIFSGGTPLGLDDPLRPTVELTFSEACQPHFDGRLLVSTNSYNMLSVGAVTDRQPTASLLVNPGQADPAGADQTIELNQRFFERTQMMVQIADGTRQGGYVSYQTQGAGTISGRLVFRQWAPQGGLMDLSFENVRLFNWQTRLPCTVNGRVVTRGLTGGS